ncbi:NAD(P)H dehydrogenase (quinone) [Mucilaginibacter mallensis]|uniref:NAD(P)H dehydrogenase (Quinone) n=1 Tax=Mucilaginibacter mallensis TaxID=652787 RepID=A0A1H1ZHT1_MUCMA|nr:NAD(P)H-dependent oxidoreductase [Mucilaginibacter mallensis]SDT33355.1 NAD(P)H dehydrogenase (quinone) [Mucilaginibacter mallensis]
MNILIIYAHPEPKSMNGAMYRTAIEHLTAAGHNVKTSDLYAMRFDPVSDRGNFTSMHDASFFKQQLEEMHATETNGFVEHINAEQEKVEWCDLMIWQFPLWWFSVPAILKGWVDRVFAMGRFFKNGHLYGTGIFKEKKALLSLTTGSSADSYVDDGFNGDIAGVLRPLHRGIFEFTGFSVLRPQIIHAPARQRQEILVEELEKWKKRLDGIFEESPVVVGKY